MTYTDSTRRAALPIVALTILLLIAGCDESTSLTGVDEASSKTELATDLAKEPPAETPSSAEMPPGESAPEKIRGQYIVVLDDDVAPLGKTGSRAVVEQQARTFVARHQGTLSHTYSHAISGFAAQLSAEAAAEIAADPNVAFVEQDQRIPLRATQSNATWGLDRVDARDGLDATYTYDATGSGVHAYIIDTGIRTSHNDFGGRAVVGTDVIGDGENGQDCQGHGTHVAGTVGGTTYGVAKDVTLYAVRVFGCGTTTSTSNIIAGIDWVTNNHQQPAVANLSLGGGASQALDNALQNMINTGVTAIVAAGNDDANACNYSPARVDDALTIGSTTSSDSRSWFSNYGSCVDLFAPGSNITSAWYTSNTATNSISGTSMASPHVAGVAALYLENDPTASPADVFSAVTGTATSGTLSSLSGSPNLLVYAPLNDSGNGDGGDGDDDTGSGDAPCTNCTLYTGSLSGTGDSEYQPDGTYYAGNGDETAYLQGPAGADFDLYLRKWNGWSWVTVASSTSSSSDEQVTYNGSSGYYHWVVDSYSGSGAYDFYLE